MTKKKIRKSLKSKKIMPHEIVAPHEFVDLKHKNFADTPKPMPVLDRVNDDNLVHRDDNNGVSELWVLATFALIILCAYLYVHSL